MDDHIVCAHCSRIISNKPIISEAAKGEGSAEQSLTCDCGERISYWQITAQLRDQKTAGFKFKKWIQSRLHSQV